MKILRCIWWLHHMPFLQLFKTNVFQKHRFTKYLAHLSLNQFVLFFISDTFCVFKKTAWELVMQINNTVNKLNELKDSLYLLGQDFQCCFYWAIIYRKKYLVSKYFHL